MWIVKTNYVGYFNIIAFWEKKIFSEILTATMTSMLKDNFNRASTQRWQNIKMDILKEALILLFYVRLWIINGQRPRDRKSHVGNISWMMNYVSEEIRANNVESNIYVQVLREKNCGSKGLNNVIPFS